LTSLDEESIPSLPGPVLEERIISLRAELEDQKLSSLHKRALAEGAESHELDEVLDSENQKEAYMRLILYKIGEKARRRPEAMPLALRRVVASLMPHEERNSEATSQDLRTAVKTSAQQVHKFQGPRCSRKNLHNYSPRRSPQRSPRNYRSDQWIN
jgi:hypothetical protein